MTATSTASQSTILTFVQRHLILVLGLASVVVPTIISLAQQAWSREDGVQGPIILATGLWLFVRNWKKLTENAQPGKLWVTLFILVPAAALYIGARAFDFLSLEVIATLGILFAAMHSFFGLRALGKLWFPILYMIFIVPMPGWFVDITTASLKEFASYAATGILKAVGYPITRAGVTLYVAQYQLLVEDACSGLNSLFSLTAVGLFYIYVLHNASWKYNAFLALFIVPVAVFANIVRVMILILLTYHFGNDAAQGFLHEFAGFFLFATALLGIFAIDKIAHPIVTKRKPLA